MCLNRLASEDWLGNSAVLQVVHHDLKTIGHTSSHFSLDKAWDHTSWVHSDRLLEFNPSIVRLHVHILDDLVCDDIRADFGGKRSSFCLISLA